MTDAEVIEIMLDGAIEHLGVTLGAAYAALGAAGLVVVPKEPTEKMVKAARLFMDPCNLKPEHENMDRFYGAGIYKAMIAEAEK